MVPDRNRQVVLRARPLGIPQAEHFEIREASTTAPRDGEFLIRNLYLSATER